MLQSTGGIRQQNQQDTPQKLKKLLVKRLWAGMEQDAEEVRHKLEDIAPEECIAMGPVETD